MPSSQKGMRMKRFVPPTRRRISISFFRAKTLSLTTLEMMKKDVRMRIPPRNAPMAPARRLKPCIFSTQSWLNRTSVTPGRFFIALDEGDDLLRGGGLGVDPELERRRKGIGLEAGHDVGELREARPEPLQGLVGRDQLDALDEGRAGRSPGGWPPRVARPRALASR